MKTLFNSAFVLLSFIIIDNLLVMLSFVVGHAFLPFVLPLSFLLAVLLFLFIEKNKNKKATFRTILVSFIVLFVSLGLATFYFDLSWDGQWYQQSAIYHLKDGWNPLLEPIREFERNNDSSIIHFPKSSWYFAASVYSTTQIFEAGKSINFILLFVAFGLIYQTLQDYGITKLRSIILTFIVVLNPVVWSEITTYLVDGLLVLYLSIYIAMLFAWFKTPHLKILLIGAFAIIGSINVKFTGLVFFGVLAAFFTIYILFFRRKILIKSFLAHALVLLAALLLFGYNPYVTNFIERGHPLYPIMGTKEYPSVFETTGRDDNEIFETPDNMKGKPLVVRMFYANFGRPDNAPYFKEKNAELIWPFTSKVSDWKAYYFHETRVSGFGPYFSAILILSFVLLLFILVSDKQKRWIALFFTVSLICTLLFSKHFWWPRFAPQTWLIPIIPLFILFLKRDNKKLNITSWILAVLFLINATIVLVSHLSWETRSSIKLRQQLTEISKQKVAIEVFYGAFKKSVEEKLTKWNIEFNTAPPREIIQNEHKQLTSVVEGYPNMVLYREAETDTSDTN